MTIKSMTGFARAGGSSGTIAWAWEVRAVNGRGLDLRLRLSPGFEALEPRARELVQGCIVRGSIGVNLATKRGDGTSDVRLNEAMLAKVIAAADLVRARTGGPPAATEGLLGLRGVLEYAEAEEGEVETEARDKEILQGLERALAGVVEARAGEGRRLKAVFEAQLAEIERLVALVTAAPARTTEAVAARLKDQVERLLAQTGHVLDPARLYQEAALLASRADVEEELKRLAAHVAAARELIASKEPAGRKLDFLAQEFNREANTLCAKAGDPDITRAGLELKSVIDQMREQVQNIE